MGIAAPLTVVRSRANVIRTTQRQIKIPVVDQTGATVGQPAFFGGLVVYFQEEASAATQSDAKFRQAEISVRELIGYTVFQQPAGGLGSVAGRLPERPAGLPRRHRLEGRLRLHSRQRRRRTARSRQCSGHQGCAPHDRLDHQV